MVSDLSTSQNKAMFRGDNKIFEITVKDADDVAVDLTGGTMDFSFKENANDPTPLVTKNSGDTDEIEFTNPTGGIAQIKIVPADTRDLKAGKYVYDVQFTTSTGSIHTLVKATPTLYDDVTQA